MIPCPACGAHAVSDDCRCPHCGSKLCAGRATSRTVAAALLGLAMAGCTTTQPLYGVTVTDYTTEPPTDTGDTGDTGTEER